MIDKILCTAWLYVYRAALLHGKHTTTQLLKRVQAAE
jgi:hypothetical protein